MTATEQNGSILNEPMREEIRAIVREELRALPQTAWLFGSLPLNFPEGAGMPESDADLERLYTQFFAPRQEGGQTHGCAATPGNCITPTENREVWPQLWQQKATM